MTAAEFHRLARSLRCRGVANRNCVLMAIILVRGRKCDNSLTEHTQRMIQGLRLNITIRNGIVFG